MKRFLSILALGLVFLSSCLSELQGDRDEVSGPSNIVLKISTKAQTKGGASDGDVMSNLHIWLVYNNSVERYLSQDDAACTISGSTATATFNDVPRGACTIYLVANLPEGSPLPKTYAVGKSINEDFLKYVLPKVENYEPPFGDSTPGMPLSTSVSLSVGAGTNRVSAELVRTCAKLSITVRNNTTNNTIILKDLIFTNKNPNVGYLFEQSDYSIPGTASFGPFMSISHSSGETVSDVIPQGSERTYIQQYMYETATNGAADLGFEIVGGLFPDGTDKATVVNVVTGGGGRKDVYKFNPNSASAQSSISDNTPYLIKSRDSDYYLYDNNGNLKAGTLVSGEQIVDSTYLWVFSPSSSSTTIKNLKTGKYISIDNSGNVSMSPTSSSLYFSFTSESNPFRFYNGYTSGSLLITSNSYTLSVKNGDVNRIYYKKYFISLTPSSDSSCYFNVYKAELKEVTLPPTFEGRLFREDGTTPADVYFDKTISSLNYINKYGIPVPLEQIRRNQDVKIVVNIHYNPNSGVLYFETSDWVDDDNETTFD